MSKKTAKGGKKAPAGGKPLAGKKVAFVGKFGYSNWWLKDYQQLTRGAGGSVVNSSGAIDILVVGEGRGGKPPGEAAKIEKRLPSVESLSLAEFAKRLLPTPEAIVAMLKKEKPTHEYWETFQLLMNAAGTAVDLSGSDFRKSHLTSAKLDKAILSQADFTNTDCRYADLSTDHTIEGAKFDGAKLYAATIRKAHQCSFRGADLKETWADDATYEGCDFREASLLQLRGDRSKFRYCDFRGADLSDAEIDWSHFENSDFTKANLSRIHAHRGTFTNAKLNHANLQRADLREASLKNADLRNANLTNAALGRADLRGANVAGADFAGAVLGGAKITGVDFSKAKNYTPQVLRWGGPKVKEFVKATTGAKQFETTAEIELGKQEHANLLIQVTKTSGRPYIFAVSYFYRDGEGTHDQIDAPTFERALLNMADRWPNATLRLDTIKAKGSPTVRGPKLQAMAVAAWAEAFGVSLATTEDLETQKESQHAEARQQRDKLMEKIRAGGAEVWNSLPYTERDRINLRGVDLSGAKLAKLSMWGRDDLQTANFAGSSLIEAEFFSSNLQSANFAKTNLSRAKLVACKCEKASFVNAKLVKTDLEQAKLQGADFTGADLTNAELTKAQFDEHTKFPAGFSIPDSMVWKGKGSRPGLRSAKAAAPGSVDFDTFFKGLDEKVEPERLEKATDMLKAERFQLYADVTDSSLVGVVKSQTNKDLVYSCRLTADGQFGCGTQNLKPCGGLQGALCKHLLVLVVGLAKAGKIDSATVDGWMAASRGYPPTLDKDALGETFLKYKGAEAGEIDWRPTETIPEDFYAV